MRDRIRSREVPVLGPINHGLCQSIYFAGPEGLCLEVACGSDIDENAWIDPEVQALAGITSDELAMYLTPADYERPSVPVPQPAYNPDRPHLGYPPAAYERVLAMPDEAFWDSVDSSPPVPQVGVEPTPYGV